MDTPFVPSTTSPIVRRREPALTIRRIGPTLLAAAAVWIVVALAPQDTGTADDITKVMLGDTLNQARTEGAPQQAVVNGWTARDPLELTAKQGAEGRDHRPAALLTLLVLGMCLALTTTAIPKRDEPGSPQGGAQSGRATAELGPTS